MALDPNVLVGPILAAIAPALGKKWADARDYAQSESEKLAITLAKIAELRAENKIDDDQAKALLDMQRHSMQAVLLAIEGIGIIAAQNAVNAALNAVRTLVNGAIGFALL